MQKNFKMCLYKINKPLKFHSMSNFIYLEFNHNVCSKSIQFPYKNTYLTFEGTKINGLTDHDACQKSQ